MPDETPEFSGWGGRILVAAPDLRAPNFKQTLVWVAEHSEEGALGFILNRPIDKNLGDVAGGPGLTPALRKVPLGFGGPVKSEQLALVLYQLEGTRWVCHWGLPPERLEAHLQEAGSRVRAYLGYAGWGEGQLEQEVQEQVWRVIDHDPDLLEPRWARGLWTLIWQRDERWKRMRGHLASDEQLN